MQITPDPLAALAGAQLDAINVLQFRLQASQLATKLTVTAHHLERNNEPNSKPLSFLARKLSTVSTFCERQPQHEAPLLPLMREARALHWNAPRAHGHKWTNVECLQILLTHLLDR